MLWKQSRVGWKETIVDYWIQNNTQNPIKTETESTRTSQVSHLYRLLFERVWAKAVFTVITFLSLRRGNGLTENLQAAESHFTNSLKIWIGKFYYRACKYPDLFFFFFFFFPFPRPNLISLNNMVSCVHVNVVINCRVRLHTRDTHRRFAVVFLRPQFSWKLATW